MYKESTLVTFFSSVSILALMVQRLIMPVLLYKEIRGLVSPSSFLTSALDSDLPPPEILLKMKSLLELSENVSSSGC